MLSIIFLFADSSDLTYKYNPVSKTWIGLANDEDHRFAHCDEAQVFCKSMGGHLLTLETYESIEWFRAELMLAKNDPENCKLTIFTSL